MEVLAGLEGEEYSIGAMHPAGIESSNTVPRFIAMESIRADRVVPRIST